MSTQTCTQFQARPDLSLFRFTTGLAGSVIVELRFTGLRPGVYDLSVEEYRTLNTTAFSLFSDADVDELLMTIIQAIELYSGKYPDRVIRLRGNNRLESTVFRVITRVFFDLLCTMFTVDEEAKNHFSPFRRNKMPDGFLLKRKPDPAGRAQPVHLTLNTHSWVSGRPVQVRLCDEMLSVR
jgi:hypothetical protein